MHRPVAQSVSQSSATPDLQESVAKSIPGPSVAPELQESVAKSSSRLSTTLGFQRSVAESVPHVPSSLEFRDTAVSAPCSSVEPELEQNLGRDYWIKVWDECSSSDSLFDDCSDDSPRGIDAQHEFNNDAGWHSDHWKHDSWHSSHCWTTEDHWKHDRRIGPSMAVKARGTNILDATVGIRVTGKQLIGIKRMSITTITLNHNGSLTHPLKL